MTLTFVPRSVVRCNDASPSLHRPLDRARLPHLASNVLPVPPADRPHLSEQLGRGDQDDRAGRGAEDGDEEDFGGHETNVGPRQNSVSTTEPHDGWCSVVQEDLCRW